MNLHVRTPDVTPDADPGSLTYRFLAFEYNVRLCIRFEFVSGKMTRFHACSGACCVGGVYVILTKKANAKLDQHVCVKMDHTGPKGESEKVLGFLFQ